MDGGSYPDSNLPTLLVYRHKARCRRRRQLCAASRRRRRERARFCERTRARQDVARTFLTLAPFGGGRTTPERVAAALHSACGICRQGEDDRHGGGDDDAQGAAQRAEELVRRVLGLAAEGDESSDFDD